MPDPAGKKFKKGALRIIMKSKKVVKGQYGYIRTQRIKVTIRTVLLFLLSLVIFFVGLWYNGGNKKNLLTVVAVLGCLPACKSAVNMIMFFRASGCAENVWERVSRCSEGLTCLYDMYFTSYEKNYAVSHLVVKDHVVCGYCSDAKCESEKCEKHLGNMLKQGGCKNVTVKIYKDLDQYCEGLSNLQRQNAESGEEQEEGKAASGQTEDILTNLLAVAL